MVVGDLLLGDFQAWKLAPDTGHEVVVRQVAGTIDVYLVEDLKPEASFI